MAHIRPSTILNQSLISKIPDLVFKEYGKILDESGSVTDKIKIQHVMPEELYKKIKFELQKN
jgi:hypothetical protein